MYLSLPVLTLPNKIPASSHPSIYSFLAVILTMSGPESHVVLVRHSVKDSQGPAELIFYDVWYTYHVTILPVKWPRSVFLLSIRNKSVITYRRSQVCQQNAALFGYLACKKHYVEYIKVLLAAFRAAWARCTKCRYRYNSTIPVARTSGFSLCYGRSFLSYIVPY